jgi:hypothetical protein
MINRRFGVVKVIAIWLLLGNIYSLDAQNISWVKSSLGELANKLSEISVSVKINKWSKFKPVRGIWPVSLNGKYAINPFSNWAYSKPYNNYRLGDFRNYNQNAKPPLYLDEDGCYEESDLYPLGSPDHSDWNFVVNTSPAYGELSYGDLGLSNYYIGFKVIDPVGTIYYKSYDAIPTFSSKVITISAGLNSHTLPYSFLNLPYGVGNFTMEFGFCTNQTNGWTTTNPGFYLLPDVTNGVNCINRYLFKVHDWVWLSNTSVAWFPGDLLYQESHISTSLDNWQVISCPSWINIAVYQNGSPIDHASLWATEMDIRLSPTDNDNTLDRNGVVEIGTGGTVLATIGVFQSAAPQNPPYAYVSTVGFDASSTDANIALNSTNLTYSLTPTNVGMNVFCSVQLLKNGDVIGSSSIFLRDNSTANGSFTLDIPAKNNDIYQIEISK